MTSILGEPSHPTPVRPSRPVHGSSANANANANAALFSLPQTPTFYKGGGRGEGDNRLRDFSLLIDLIGKVCMHVSSDTVHDLKNPTLPDRRGRRRR